jgi:hypothetical protein
VNRLAERCGAKLDGGSALSLDGTGGSGVVKRHEGRRFAALNHAELAVRIPEHAGTVVEYG